MLPRKAHSQGADPSSFLAATNGRRGSLHDIAMSDWWILFAGIPVIGWVVGIFWYATDGERSSNRLGLDPELDQGSRFIQEIVLWWPGTESNRQHGDFQDT